ncbi:hypothetical protein Tco_0514747 [Tanacetum coccineum]
MANLSKDIQCAGSDTRPPMLDRTDFASWQQRIRLYCRGKENGVNILKSIDEGPFKMGKFRETLADGAQCPERDRVFKDLTPEEKDRRKADIHAPERTSSNTRNQATVQNGKVVVQNVQGRQNRVQGNNARGAVAAGNEGVQNRVGNENPSQAKPIKCYNCNEIRHIENGVVLDEEQLLFIEGGQYNTFDDDVDEPPVQDLALNVDQTMFMENLSSANLIYDKDGPSYDSDILSEVQDHDNYLDNVGEYHEADQCISANEQNKVVNESLIVELARYKEQVEIYEKRARLELTEREQRIDEQLRIIITDRNIQEESLKKELHSVKMQLNSTIDHNKLMKEEVATLKKDFKQK